MMRTRGQNVTRWLRGLEGIAVLVVALGVLPSCSGPGASEPIAQVRSVGDAYESAIQNGDAQAAAACWTEDAEFVNQSTGLRITGQQAIQGALATVLSDKGTLDTETGDSTVRLIGPELAVEEGRSWIASDSGAGRSVRFVTLYAKRDGGWKIHRLWQTEAAVGSHYAHLRPLAWMIGEWSDDGDGKTVKNVCRWTQNRNFITRTFEVSEGGKVTGKGTEVIGWDPTVEAIRSWTFDSAGGFAGSLWRSDGDEWRPEVLVDMKPGDPSKRREALAPLGWMVGDWAEQGEAGAVHSSCQWAGESAFLVHRWRTSSVGATPLEGITVVGWDPVAEQVCSWVFDTDGGFADATWSRAGDAWYAKTSHVLPDGRRGASITIYRKAGDDALAWQRVSQELDGEILPNAPEVTVHRSAAPQAPKETR